MAKSDPYRKSEEIGTHCNPSFLYTFGCDDICAFIRSDRAVDVKTFRERSSLRYADSRFFSFSDRIRLSADLFCTHRHHYHFQAGFYAGNSCDETQRGTYGQQSPPSFLP